MNSTEVELGQSPGGFTRPPLWYIYFTPKGIYIYIPFSCKKSKKNLPNPISGEWNIYIFRLFRVARSADLFSRIAEGVQKGVEEIMKNPLERIIEDLMENVAEKVIEEVVVIDPFNELSDK